jgi:hypothetical protein
MKKIAKLLKADFNESSDLASIAAMLASKGRGKDTLLVHITPREAQILKDLGGSGTTNPETGLLEFDPVETSYVPDFGYGQAGDISTTQGVSPETGQIYNVEAPPSGDIAPVSVPQISPTASAGGAVSAQPTQVSTPSFGTTGAAGQDVQLSTFPTQVAPSPYAGREQAIGETELTTPPPEKTGFLDKLTKGLTTEQMARLGLAGGLGVLGAQRARQGAGQIQAATQEQKALAQPYQAQGQELVRAAQAGELTPASQQRLQATQAAIAQGVESRGGVGAQQAAAQVEALRQQLLQNQYTYGLQIAQIGDNIALGAIRTGLQLDNSLQQATGNFYTNLAMVAGGIPTYRTTT